MFCKILHQDVFHSYSRETIFSVPCVLHVLYNDDSFPCFDGYVVPFRGKRTYLPYKHTRKYKFYNLMCIFLPLLAFIVGAGFLMHIVYNKILFSQISFRVVFFT